MSTSIRFSGEIVKNSRIICTISRLILNDFAANLNNLKSHDTNSHEILAANLKEKYLIVLHTVELS